MSPDPTQPNDSPDSELLMDGQEEVFSRTEVERGAIEHHSLEEDETLEGAKGDPAEGKRDLHGAKESPPKRRHETKVNLDETMAENFRSDFNPRP